MTSNRDALRVAIVTETYSPKMGYAPAALSKALAAESVDVHVITPRLAPYSTSPDFEAVYGGFAAQEQQREVERIDGYTVHYVDHERRLGYVRLKGLHRALKELQPDIVQTFVAISWLPLEAAVYKPLLSYKLFTGSHTTASVFPLAQQPVRWSDPRYLRTLLQRALPGRLISLATEKSYPATVDCADVARRFFGVPAKKMEIMPLGVDTEVFHVARTDEERAAAAGVRELAGCAPGDVLCIYTGRFTEEKNPALLARAVERLRRSGEPYRALFVGNGPQVEAIRSCDGAVVHQFTPFHDLGRFYRAADIAVFPTQESMSMLDAAACGVPVVVNDTLQATERIEGNGVTYRLNDLDDLVRVLSRLHDPNLRRTLGETGARRMAEQFSWGSLARRRIRDYCAAVGR